MATILVIDDETAILRNIREALEWEGYEVLSAADGLRGIQIATESHPDLVICDVAMPVLDGFTVLQKLRGRAETCHVPLILITGIKEPDVLRRIQEQVGDNHLAKPFTLDQLLEAVHRHVE